MKNYTLKRLPVVEDDIYEAAAWYVEKSPDARLDLALTAEVDAAIESLRTTAEHHRVRFLDVRRAPLRRFSFYGIYYVVRDDAVVIIAVFHDRRRPARLRRRRREVDGEF